MQPEVDEYRRQNRLEIQRCIAALPPKKRSSGVRYRGPRDSDSQSDDVDDVPAESSDYRPDVKPDDNLTARKLPAASTARAPDRRSFDRSPSASAGLPLAPVRQRAPTPADDASPPRKRAIISDNAIAPPQFKGSSDEAEGWVTHFEQFVAYKELNDDDKIKLFGLLMRSSAQDWYTTLRPEEKATFDTIIAAFREAYCPSPELVWSEASKVWRQDQHVGESVDLFVTRLRKAARRVHMTDEALNYAIIQGLRGPIRMAVLQQGVEGLQQTLRRARIAEASLASDPVTSILMESLNAQTAKMEDIASKVAALASAPEAVQAPIGPPAQTATPANTQSGGGQQQRNNQRRQTPQNQQRRSYGQQQQQPQQQQFAPSQGYQNYPPTQYQQLNYQPPQQSGPQAGWFGGEQAANPTAGHGGPAPSYQQPRQQYQPPAGHGGQQQGYALQQSGG